MSNYFYIFSVPGKTTSSLVQYYTNVPALGKNVNKAIAIPLPKSGTQPTATGQPMEAWVSENKPKDDKVEGGLYKCTLSPSGSALGAKQTVYWMIQDDARTRDKENNDVVGQAVIISGIGSVQDSSLRPTVVPVLSCDGSGTSSAGTRLYYFQSPN